MSDKRSVFRTHLDVADIYHQKYQHTDITLALQSKENICHFILKLIAFCLLQDKACQFSKELSEHKPDLYIKNEIGQYSHWVDSGTPSIKKITKALHQAQQVTIVTSDQGKWYNELPERIKQDKKLNIIKLDERFIDELNHDLALKLCWSVVIDQQVLSITVGDHFYQTEIEFIPEPEYSQ